MLLKEFVPFKLFERGRAGRGVPAMVIYDPSRYLLVRNGPSGLGPLGYPGRGWVWEPAP